MLKSKVEKHQGGLLRMWWKRLLALGVAVFLSLPVIGLATEKDKILARVGPYQLTEAQLNAQVAEMPAQIQVLLAHQPELKKELVNRWVEISLLSLEAEKEGLNEDPLIKARIQQARSAILAQELIRRQIIDKTEINDAEARKYYQENKAQFSQPERIKARHILIAVEDPASADSKKAAREKAEKILARVRAGEDFAELAKKYSDDPGSREKGGDLGFFSRGQMIEPFEKAAFSLKVGEISGLVESPFGYHIIKVEERQPAQTTPYEKVKEQVREKALEAKRESVLEAYLQQLRKKYPVSTYLK
nr:peptidylprolyl isomerase [Thermosulfuriphilus ammonigenes]